MCSMKLRGGREAPVDVVVCSCHPTLPSRLTPCVFVFILWGKLKKADINQNTRGQGCRPANRANAIPSVASRIIISEIRLQR